MSIRYEKQGRVATIVLDRAEAMNAVNAEMSEKLTQAWTDFRDDPEVWVAIVTGTGDRAFCAGADLKEMSARLAENKQDRFWQTDSTATAHAAGLGLNIYKPVIAAINGYCLGLGLTLACACDIRIASPNATFAFPEVRHGVPTVAAALLLPRLVSLGAAAQLLLVGEAISAPEAYRLGLVNKIVPQSELLGAAQTFASQFCAAAPLAVRVTKEVMLRGLSIPFEDALRLGESLRRIVYDSEDARQGSRAFVEKRLPQFQGR